jgi:hypothetical protein
VLCTPHHLSFGPSNKEELVGRGMWNLRARGEVHAGFGWVDLREGTI